MKIIGRIKNMFKRDTVPDTVIEDGYEIKRDGADAPKEIKSKDIVSFELEFSTLEIEDGACKVEPGRYTFKASLSGERVLVDVKSYPHSGEALRRSVETDADFMSRVQNILDRFDAVRFNGFYHNVAGLPDFCGAHISVRYSSGESLDASDNQEMFLDFEMLFECKELFEDTIRKKCEV